MSAMNSDKLDCDKSNDNEPKETSDVETRNQAMINKNK